MLTLRLWLNKLQVCQADLENVLNEAALVAARRSKTRIDASDIDETEDRVIAGPEKTAKFQKMNVKLWLTMKQVIQLLV